MNLRDLVYFNSLAEHRHFGHAAEACQVSQPTLSSQIRKLEDELGVQLLERTNKRVDLTPVGARILEHARVALNAAASIRDVAQASRDPLVGPIKLGVIPTLAPYLMPYILRPIHAAYPNLTIDLWEDQTQALIDALRNHKLDAALLATKTDAPEITEIALFEEPLMAALPKNHRLARKNSVREEDLADELLVLAEGHCLANQALAACGTKHGRLAGPGQPGCGGIRSNAYPCSGSRVLAKTGYCRAAARRPFSPHNPAREPARLSPPPGPAGNREGDPKGRWRQGSSPLNPHRLACGKYGQNSPIHGDFQPNPGNYRNFGFRPLLSTKTPPLAVDHPYPAP